MPGKLYIVATPIGHLGDITLRALEVLKSVDIIACENRERHLKLLNHYAIKKRLLEYSPAAEANSAKGLVKLLLEGQNIALVSDAGTPGVSDPGVLAVREAREAGIEIEPIPGASALPALVSVSGFSSARTIFLGFLSKSPGKRSKELRLYQNIDALIVIYASQYQIKKVLESIMKILGNDEILIGREMTKLNAQYLKGTCEELLAMELPNRGEYALAVNHRAHEEVVEDDDDFSKD